MTTLTDHVTPAVIESPDWPSLSVPDAPIGSATFVAAAGHAARVMPSVVHDALVDFADAAPQSGAIVLRGLPVGSLPLTPPSPTAPTHKDLTSEFVLLAAARRLGQPVGYLPEHGGDLVQNLVPVQANADRQVSTSSKVDLMFHTEAAFHPHRPRYLLLLCLRGDERAVTTLSSIFEVLPLLPWRVVDTLFQPRFRTAVDESYLHGRTNVLGAPMPVLRGERHRPSMVFDAELMVGTDTEADDALRALSEVVEAHHTGLALQAGDLLVVDNNVAVHGRSSYEPRWDGHDRWLQRAMVVADLAPSAGERDGRIIVTHFGA
ncbi:MAG: TauD/TfdA family dioxygenase [Actinobacteria bacterium]|nr:TauD/TfdA family dioxygenase [Actinomycetota bacterium]